MLLPTIQIIELGAHGRAPLRCGRDGLERAQHAAPVLRLGFEEPVLHAFHEGEVAAGLDFAGGEGFHAAELAGGEGEVGRGLHFYGGGGVIGEALIDGAGAVLDGDVPVAAALAGEVELDDGVGASGPLGAKEAGHALDDLPGG